MGNAFSTRSLHAVKDVIVMRREKYYCAVHDWAAKGPCPRQHDGTVTTYLVHTPGAQARRVPGRGSGTAVRREVTSTLSR